MSDPAAIVRRFRSPGCARLVERLRQRLARGDALTGTLQLTDATEDERADIALLVGRRPGRGRNLVVSLEALDSDLRALGFPEGLRGVIEAVLGPVEDERQAAAAREAAWASLWADALAAAEGNPAVGAWIEDLRVGGLLVRASRRDLEGARALLAAARRVVEGLPARGERLATLAARVAGDSHALDAGRPLASLVLRFRPHGLATPLDSDDEEQTRRSRWAALSVALDELSAPALVLGLAPAGAGPSARLLRLMAEAGEPCLMPLRLLLRDAVAEVGTLAGTPVFVCENPTVVSVAADRLGRRCPPLVCTQGMPGAATQVLLRQLSHAGALLRYHGDFDWPGIRIGGWIMNQCGARPWRFDVLNYLGAPAGTPLTGLAQPTPWDSPLCEAMSERGRVVHEEAVIDALLEDLSVHAKPVLDLVEP